MRLVSLSVACAWVSLWGTPPAWAMAGLGEGASQTTYLAVRSPLLSYPELHRALRLTPRQVTQVRQLKLQFRRDVRKTLPQRTSSPDPQKRVARLLAVEAKLRLLASPYESKLAQVLNSSQLRRLAEIHLQYCMVTRPLRLLAFNQRVETALKLNNQQLLALKKNYRARLLNPSQPRILQEIRRE